MKKPVSRRSFVASSALAAAPAFLSAQTSGDKIALGWVGLGNRGGKHIHTMVAEAKGDAFIKTICDTYTPRMAATKDKLISGGAPAPERGRSSVRAALKAPRTPAEEQMVACWEEVLDMRQ